MAPTDVKNQLGVLFPLKFFCQSALDPPEVIGSHLALEIGEMGRTLGPLCKA